MKPIRSILYAITGCTIVNSSILATSGLPACFQNPDQACLLDLAREATQNIRDPFERTIALAALASQEALLGQPNAARDQFEAALATSKTIEWPEARFTALTSIAGSQIDAGFKFDAKRILNEAEALFVPNIAIGEPDVVQPWLRRIREIAELQAKLGATKASANNYELANTTTKKLNAPFMCLSEWMLTTLSQIGAGDEEGAAHTLQLAEIDVPALGDSKLQYAAWLDIGQRWLQLNRRNDAKAAADKALSALERLGTDIHFPNQTAALATFMLELTDE